MSNFDGFDWYTNSCLDGMASDGMRTAGKNAIESDGIVVPQHPGLRYVGLPLEPPSQ